MGTGVAVTLTHFLFLCPVHEGPPWLSVDWRRRRLAQASQFPPIAVNSRPTVAVGLPTAVGDVSVCLETPTLYLFFTTPERPEEHFVPRQCPMLCRLVSAGAGPRVGSPTD
jgi:hypothetical protein